MSKENKLIPELRFPEFVSDGEWEEKSFKELFKIGNGRDYKHLGKGEVPVYGSGGYMLSVNDYLYDGESVCIGRKGTIDKPMFLKGKFWTVDTLFYTQTFEDCLPKYIYYVFQNIDWLKHNEAGGVPSLSKTNIYKIETLIPKLQEQQKIASCLSSLDELIAAHNDKLQVLKDHKKGLMQNLFPQEGEKVPKYRFPEFEKDGEWEEKELGNITNYVDYRGKTPTKSVKGVFLVTAKNIKEGYIDYDISKEYIDIESYEDVMARGKPKIGDVLLTTEAPLGNVACIDKKGIALAQRVIKFRGKEKIINNAFLKQIFLSPNFQNQLEKNSSGSTAKGIKGSVLRKLSISFPKIQEQQKIASCLSSLDELITAQAEKIEQLKLHKKGLMQGLFPKR